MLRLLGAGSFRLRAVNEFDVGHRGVVAGAEAAFENTQVAAGAGLVARAQGGEKRPDGLFVAQARKGEAAVGDGVNLAQGNQTGVRRRGAVPWLWARWS